MAIEIKKSKKGLFTEFADANGMSVAEAAKYVMDNKNNYSASRIEQANFAKNSESWNHKKNGGDVLSENEKHEVKKELGDEFLEHFKEGVNSNKANELLENHDNLNKHQRSYLKLLTIGYKCGGMIEGYDKGGEVTKTKGQKLNDNGEDFTYDGKYWVNKDGSKKVKGDYYDSYLKQQADKASQEDKIYQGQKTDALKRHYDLIKNDPSRKDEADRLAEQLNPKQIPTKTGKQINNTLNSGQQSVITNKNGLAKQIYTGPKDENSDIQPPSNIKEPERTLYPTQTKEQKDLVDSALKQEAISNSQNKNPNYLGAANSIANSVGGLANYYLPFKQYQLGQQYLAQTGARPKGSIDPDFQNSVNQATVNSKYGFSPEEQTLLNNQNINALRAGQNAAQNYSGGSAANAINLTRQAANDYSARGLANAVANKQLMLQKQQISNGLNESKAAMNRQLFQDNLNAFQQNQQAGSNLIGAGLQNFLGAQRLNNENRFQQQYAQNSNPYSQGFFNNLGQ